MFSGRVAVITGASSGIGRAVAKQLAAAGAKVGLLARRAEELRQLAAEIGPAAAFVSLDVTDRMATLAAFARLKERLGPVDLLVANAGVALRTDDFPPDVAGVEQLFRVNVFGVIYAIEAVLPDMLARNAGHIAAISSLAAYKGLPGQPAYCASKAAVNAYLEGMRVRLSRTNVAVTTICPGFIRTAMTAGFTIKLPFLMDADEAARRIVRALARRRKVFNFPWPTTALVKLSRWLPDRVMNRVGQ